MGETKPYVLFVFLYKGEKGLPVARGRKEYQVPVDCRVFKEYRDIQV
ncbi:hypothetical protein [Paenibacillus caseinilyticus]|nr:hypothetical protein [Paenibacillus caseinilyticus]MCZ8520368.1 hypothetical protein [Paenibacillus caseinilyticus]